MFSTIGCFPSLSSRYLCFLKKSTQIQPTPSTQASKAPHTTTSVHAHPPKSPISITGQHSRDALHDAHHEVPPPPPLQHQEQVVTKALENIDTFFKEVSSKKVRNVGEVAVDFGIYCALDDWDFETTQSHRAAMTKVAMHFVRHYKKAIARDIQRRWTYDKEANNAEFLPFFQRYIAYQAQKIEQDVVWPCLWIQELFTISNTIAASLQNNVSLQKELLSHTKKEVIKALLQKHVQNVDYDHIIQPEHRSELLQHLHKVFLKSPTDTYRPHTKLLQEFETYMFYDFLEKMLGVTKEDIYRFEGFEFRRRS